MFSMQEDGLDLRLHVVAIDLPRNLQTWEQKQEKKNKKKNQKKKNKKWKKKRNKTKFVNQSEP